MIGLVINAHVNADECSVPVGRQDGQLVSRATTSRRGMITTHTRVAFLGANIPTGTAAPNSDQPQDDGGHDTTWSRCGAEVQLRPHRPAAVQVGHAAGGLRVGALVLDPGAAPGALAATSPSDSPCTFSNCVIELFRQGTR
jgi:hypothetical protein